MVARAPAETAGRDERNSSRRRIGRLPGPDEAEQIETVTTGERREQAEHAQAVAEGLVQRIVGKDEDVHRTVDFGGATRRSRTRQKSNQCSETELVAGFGRRTDWASVAIACSAVPPGCPSIVHASRTVAR